MARAIDTGTAYGRQPGTYDRWYVETAAGTMMGEYLRRFWQPIALSSQATATPRPIRALSEDLILFRDGAGRAGLLTPRCVHRGTTLYYGRVEERGIRCCYHGWLFDVEGNCLEQPCEPELGKRRHTARQPWYPVAERYGLVFAYMGPPERKPVLPRWDVLEELAPDETIEADDHFQSGPAVIPCSWTHHFDNVPDHFHVPVLHGSFSGAQFADLLARMPEVSWEASDVGVSTLSRRKLDDGKTLLRITEARLPNARLVPDPNVSKHGRGESVSWILPIDDTHHRLYIAMRKTPGWERKKTRPGGKAWEELDEAGHQRFPDDYEAQVGQGAITLHSEERLASSDRGVSMLRRLVRQQAQLVADGGDPAGVSFDENAPPVQTVAGNFLVDE